LGRGEKEDEKILTICPHPDLFPRGGEGRKEFNGTPHFGSLPGGERRIRRMPPHPDPLPQSGEGKVKMEGF
jgi:hypothetical protein